MVGRSIEHSQNIQNLDEPYPSSLGVPAEGPEFSFLSSISESVARSFPGDA